MVTCIQCKTKNPKSSRYCSKCGADLQASGAAQKARGARGAKGCFGCLGVIVAVFVLITAFYAVFPSLKPKEQLAATAVPTAAVPLAVQTAQAQQAAREARRVAKAAAQQAKAAKAGARQAQQDDFRTFAGQLTGIQQGCLDGAQVAQKSFTAAGNGGDSVQAYSDAQAAQDACDTAKNNVALLTVPDSLSSLRMDDAKTTMFAWAEDEGNFWNDVKKVLQNNADVAAAADGKKMAAEMKTYNDQVVVALASAAVQLGVSMDSVTPTTP